MYIAHAANEVILPLNEEKQQQHEKLSTKNGREIITQDIIHSRLRYPHSQCTLRKRRRRKNLHKLNEPHTDCII